MALAGQNVQQDRYAVVPRTLIFLLSDEKILLIKLGQEKDAWSGKYNGLGGHIEPGEDPLTAARREVIEEASVDPSDLYLSGVVLIKTGASPGIGLFVFTGTSTDLEVSATREGYPEWIALSDLDSLPLLSDLKVLIPAALKSRKTKQPFSALTTFDENGDPIVQFANG
jgi:8-oxo-dGTP diphosphatase